MSDLKNIIVTIYNRVSFGSVTGKANLNAVSEEDAIEARNSIQSNLNNLTTLTLFTEDGTEVTIAGDTIKRSLFSFKIANADEPIQYQYPRSS